MEQLSDKDVTIKEMEEVAAACVSNLRAIDDVVELINGKWKIKMIARLCYKTMRYFELLKDIDGISGKSLSRELRFLEINGLIVREVSSTIPISVRYNVSDHGKSLRELVLYIAKWGHTHRQLVISNF